jgi:hypothetical protein
MSDWINSPENDQRQSFYSIPVARGIWTRDVIVATVWTHGVTVASIWTHGVTVATAWLWDLRPHKISLSKNKTLCKGADCLSVCLSVCSDDFHMAKLGNWRNPGCYSRQLETWKIQVFGMWHIVIGWFVPDVLKDCVPIIFKGNQSMTVWSVENRSPSDTAIYRKGLECPLT